MVWFPPSMCGTRQRESPEEILPGAWQPLPWWVWMDGVGPPIGRPGEAPALDSYISDLALGQQRQQTRQHEAAKEY
jgi:hypothetical protein